MKPIIQGAPSMQQVADWLEKIGLGQYAKSFAENDIIFGILPDLTDQDLEKIGVASQDDAERAVRAGLELIQAVGELKSSASLQTRVGIATGVSRSRRPDWIGRLARARHRRRDTEPCGTAAKHCRS